MRITSKMAKEMLAVLDELREEIKNEKKKPYPYAEWERIIGFSRLRGKQWLQKQAMEIRAPEIGY